MDYPKLPNHLKQKWNKIPPSHGAAKNARPCMAILDDGAIVDAVYVVHAQDYISLWGNWPKDDKGKREIDISRVRKLKESPNRLPLKFAEVLYQAGESNMGGLIFTIIFKDNSKQVYGTGNAIDFLKLPKGKVMDDIVEVLPHEGRQSTDLLTTLDYYWCLFDSGE
jgi:hypothetical protein